LYQLATYLAHEERRSGVTAAGMLLYPQTSVELHEQYTLLGHSVTVATINLAQDWRTISSGLRELLMSAIHR
jgi:hypothetical protein